MSIIPSKGMLFICLQFHDNEIFIIQGLSSSWFHLKHQNVFPKNIFESSVLIIGVHLLHINYFLNFWKPNFKSRDGISNECTSSISSKISSMFNVRHCYCYPRRSTFHQISTASRASRLEPRPHLINCSSIAALQQWCNPSVSVSCAPRIGFPRQVCHIRTVSVGVSQAWMLCCILREISCQLESYCLIHALWRGPLQVMFTQISSQVCYMCTIY